MEKMENGGKGAAGLERAQKVKKGDESVKAFFVYGSLRPDDDSG